MSYALALGALVAAVLLRWVLDPLMGDALPLVTLSGAVAVAVFVGGYRPAVLVSGVGYLACEYLFIPPRGRLHLDRTGDLVGLAAYAFTCVIIIALGELARRAQRRAKDHTATQLRTARLLAAIVESSDDAIISKSLDGIIQSWNLSAESLFGYTAAQAVGRHISLVIPPDRISEEDEIVANLKAGRRIDHFETERLRSDGRRVHVSLTISPIVDDAGNVIGASKIARDIAERRRVEEDLRRVAGELSEADRRKNEFLAMLAHELRNPLAPISNAVRVLRLDGEDPVAVHAATAMLERQVGQMVRLVEDLLDVSRISQGKIELRNEPLELAPIISQVVEANRALYRNMGHELTVSLPPEPVYLCSDQTRLAQVLGNLLNNACKFTDRGGCISLSVERANTHAVIRVRDSGVGIAPEHLQRIFEMFTQVESSVERSRSGLGIGLTLAKTLVEMQGGTVEAFSDGPGRGSEFVVRLPAMAESPESLSRTSAMAGEPAAVRRRILIVDDNEDAAEWLATWLNLNGHETHVVHAGPAAIEAAQRVLPDAVLLDIGLPGLDGYEVCRRIREQPWGKTLALVALTGWGQEEDRRKSREAGFDTHLVKPVDEQVLTDLLASLPSRSDPGGSASATTAVQS